MKYWKNSFEEVDSPLPNINVHGLDDDLLEVQQETGSPLTIDMSLPGSPQKKVIQPIIEEEDKEERYSGIDPPWTLFCVNVVLWKNKLTKKILPIKKI